MLLRLMLIGLPAKDKLAILIKSQCPTFEKEVYTAGNFTANRQGLVKSGDFEINRCDLYSTTFVTFCNLQHS